MGLEVRVNILVCGFMGCGKTTFVEAFQRNHLGYEALDLDTAVALSVGLLPSELGEWINKHGLEVFRHKESLLLSEMLSTASPKIIALGGGTIEAPGFWDLAKKHKLVFLDVPFETCFERIKNDSNRPQTKLGEVGLRSLYQKRLPLYQKADLHLSQEGIKKIVSLSSLVHNLEG